MLTVKQQIQEVLNSLPDDCTFEDFRYNLYVRRKVEEGIRAADAGEVFTIEQALAQVKQWRKSYGQSPPSTT